MLLVKEQRSDVASGDSRGFRAVSLFVTFGKVHISTRRLLHACPNGNALRVAAVREDFVALELGPRSPVLIERGKAVGITCDDGETFPAVLNEAVPVVGVFPNGYESRCVHTKRKRLLVFNFDHLASPFLGYEKRVAKSL